MRSNGDWIQENIMISTGNLWLLFIGMRTTIMVWLGAASCSLVLGMLFGLLGCSSLRVSIVSPFISLLTLFLRGIPFYVQLLISYFVLPSLFGFNGINALLVATLTLGICSAAYMSQAVVTGMNGIGVDQWETGFVLGYSKIQIIRFIILPQLMWALLPSLCAEADQLIKSTALFSSIGIMELTGMARNIIARELNPIPVYLFLALIYLVFSLIINGFIYYMRKKRVFYVEN